MRNNNQQNDRTAIVSSNVVLQ